MNGEFLRDWLRNFLLLAAVVLGMGAFVAIFYPDTLKVFGQVFTLMNMLLGLPLLVVLLAVFTMPRRRSRRSGRKGR